jgi:hypothetical protein
MMEVSGGCHCGAVRFQATMPEPPVPALDCNCSVCSMTGFLHIMVPHEQFELLTGRNTRAAEHLFCSTCGVKSFYQPRSHSEAWSVNANCLDNPIQLSIEKFDGREWERAKAALDDGDHAG